MCTKINARKRGSKDTRLRILFLRIVLPVTVLLISGQVHAHCYREAGQRYRIDPTLLRAIAYTESSLNPDVESHTSDIGLMGINRSWLPILKTKFGLNEADVWNPCTNIHIGAWILANNYRQFGKNWNAVGAYNAACKKLKGYECQKARTAYSNKVYRNWERLKNQPF